MKNMDTRVQYTKARFHEAMLEMLEQKPIGSVTVKALCDAAGLNRGTFYLHYAEPIDVLREMEWALYERVLQYAFRPGEGDGLLESFARQLAALEQERRLCAAVIGHNGDPLFMPAVSERAYAMLRETLLQTDPACSEDETRMRFRFLFSGVTGVITAWLHGDTQLSDAELANMLVQMSTGLWETNKA